MAFNGKPIIKSTHWKPKYDVAPEALFQKRILIKIIELSLLLTS